MKFLTFGDTVVLIIILSPQVSEQCPFLFLFLFPQEASTYFCDGEGNVVCLEGWSEHQEEDLRDPKRCRKKESSFVFIVFFLG